MGTASPPEEKPKRRVPRRLIFAAFLDQNVGKGAVERLIPALRDSTTLGDAIHTALQVDPTTLESA